MVLNKNYRNATLQLIVLPIVLLALLVGMIPKMEAQDILSVRQGDDEIMGDSLISEEANPELTIARAVEKYKHLKFIQYDGVTEEELYPETMQVYIEVLKANEITENEDVDKSQLKSILNDIHPLILQGALYYSSIGESEKMAAFATAYVDIHLRPELHNLPLSGEGKSLYPALIYTAASNAYNKSLFEDALKYFKEYLATGAKDYREQVYLFFAQACINASLPGHNIETLIAGTSEYPANINLLMLTLQNCLDGDREDLMQPLLDKALLLKPEDAQLLNLQARVYENGGYYSNALDIYSRLDEMMPNNMGINKHLALCYYNLGADYYNRAIMESDEKQSKKYSRQSNAYFTTAADKLNTVIENDPTNVKYLRALAYTYGCLGRKDKFDEINVRLSALGEQTMAMNGMPESIAFAEKKGKTQENSAQTYTPDFQEYAKDFVERELAKWTERQEFEKNEDYQKRVNQESVFAYYQNLCKQAESEYIKKYASRLRLSELKLNPYDIDHETYLIESEYGDIVIHVPLKNKEAELFKNNWNTIKINNPRYFIQDNQVVIKSVDFVTSAGKTYSYRSENSANYDYTDVKLDVNSFIAQNANKRSEKNKPTEKTTVIRAKSDVDRDIPRTSRHADNTIALIMANENYKNVSNVTCALNDGETFSKYCNQTLGIPDKQVILIENLTYAEMLGAISRLKQLVNSMNDEVEVIFYYAGHGFPDEASKDAYLLPIDGDGYSTTMSYPLKQLYHELSGLRANSVMVFLDACFSGATRSEEMLKSVRGVALKPQMATPEGNMYILSAASDQETALPYMEKNHGMFTYFLLKKLQESKGNVTLEELSRYVEENVKKHSLTINGKLQTPTTSVSGKMSNEWRNKKLRP